MIYNVKSAFYNPEKLPDVTKEPIPTKIKQIKNKIS